MNDHRISRRSFLAAAGIAGAAAALTACGGAASSTVTAQLLPWHPLPPLLHKQPRAWS